MDNELLKQVTEKAEKWLSPEYDEEINHLTSRAVFE